MVFVALAWVQVRALGCREGVNVRGSWVQSAGRRSVCEVKWTG